MQTAPNTAVSNANSAVYRWVRPLRDRSLKKIQTPSAQGATLAATAQPAASEPTRDGTPPLCSRGKGTVSRWTLGGLDMHTAGTQQPPCPHLGICPRATASRNASSPCAAPRPRSHPAEAHLRPDAARRYGSYVNAQDGSRELPEEAKGLQEDTPCASGPVTPGKRPGCAWGSEL